MKPPIAIEAGPLPTITGDSVAWVNVPSPSPKSMNTLLELKLATARSSNSSPSKSLTATEDGPILPLLGILLLE